MQAIPQIYQTMYSELAQRAVDAPFASEFDVSGRFVAQDVKGRKYWYFDTAGEGGKKKRTYIGPVADPEITKRVEAFKDLKADARTRRKIISTLVNEAYLLRPEKLTGEIVQSLARAGFFRLRGVLIGTVAYQCYPAVLGVRLPGSAMVTGDVDFAQFHSISVGVSDEMSSVLDLLRAIDPTFREIPHHADGRFTTQYKSRGGYKVEFLTPNRGCEEYTGRPTPMPALAGTHAQPLRFLDFLIDQPIRAVLLHGSGVPVNVPAPERYAIHKLIVASRRRLDNDGSAKSRKDRAQALSILEALIGNKQVEDIADAFVEAYDRGPAWREAIGTSMALLPDAGLARIREALADGIDRLGLDLKNYGMASSRPPGP